MNENIDEIRAAALAEFESAATEKDARETAVKYLGRKGVVSEIMRGLGGLPPDERKDAGRRANELKKALEQAAREAGERVANAAAGGDAGLDPTLPGRPAPYGRLHPLTQVNNEICDIFVRLGFDVVEGPEVELDYYNFEALNFPKDHPARDMQDTFFVSEDVVLRTHTSPLQVRTMEKQRPPVRMIAPGRVYRCDSDITHTPMFHQVEGLVVDRGISFPDLKGCLVSFVHHMFDPETRVRFRPSFFPFTEPSAEVDIQCVSCRGAGCRVCSQTGWLEILGAGMVHPRVFEFVDYDTSEYTGFAFGLGVERIAMLKYGTDDLRRFFDNDLRFLRQF
ncbi:MAG: phenylalanine--tRNA ligase subunit alpha [Desulfatibacillaceae bacterium]